eukprot:g63554.t1
MQRARFVGFSFTGTDDNMLIIFSKLIAQKITTKNVDNFRTYRRRHLQTVRWAGICGLQRLIWGSPKRIDLPNVWRRWQSKRRFGLISMFTWHFLCALFFLTDFPEANHTTPVSTSLKNRQCLTVGAISVRAQLGHSSGDCIPIGIVEDPERLPGALRQANDA